MEETPGFPDRTYRITFFFLEPLNNRCHPAWAGKNELRWPQINKRKIR
jgi:hypothetical protein